MDLYFYKRYKLVWTGWKSTVNMIELVGQWIAIPLDSGSDITELLYACTSGTFGILKCPGYVMNISKMDSVPWIWAHSSEVEKEIVKEDTRKLLMDLIDRGGDCANL